MVTETSQRKQQDNKGSSAIKWVLIALAILALLLVAAFALGWISIDSAGGDIDVETPNTDVEVDGPDLDVDVDGELEGDADADAEAPS